MNSSPNPSEEVILQKVDKGLEMAVEHKGYDWDYGTYIKRQKYASLALKEFLGDDMGDYITYSWYKYGFSAYASPASDFASSTSPATTDESLTSPDIRQTDIYEANPEDIRDIFLNDIDDIPLDEYWYKDDLTFLKRFYRLYAPTEYRQLYLENVRLREIFEDAIEEVESLIERSDEIENPVLNYYQDVGEVVTRFHMEIASGDSVSEALDEVMEYTDILEDTFMSLEEADLSEPDTTHKEVLEELYEVYQNHVWTMVACRVSIATADGPNKDLVVGTSENKLESREYEHKEKMTGLREACNESNLLPSVEDYPTHDDEMEEKIDDLLGTTEGRSK